MKINGYTIKKEIAYGMMGTVYDVTKNGEHFALKIEHILEKEKTPNKQYAIWSEIYFSLNFANKYPDQFIKLYYYAIINKCEHTQKYFTEPTKFPIERQIIYHNLANSPFCMIKVYSLIDMDLNMVVKHKLFKKSNYYSMLAQIIYALKLMYDNGYYHGDVHPGNIGIIKTKDKYVIMNKLNKLIPTHGFKCKLIDYGSVKTKVQIKTNSNANSNANTISNSNSNKIFNSITTEELDYLIELVYKPKLFEFIEKHKYVINSFDEEYAICEQNHIFRTEIIPLLDPNITKIKEYQLTLFNIIHPQIYQKIVLGSNFKKVIPSILYIEVEDIIFLLNAGNDYNKLIRYFIGLC